MKRLATLIALSAASVPIAGCDAVDLVRLYFQEQEYQQDQELIARIKGALLADPQLGQVPVRVEAYLGDVRLYGTVASFRQKQRAETVAEEVDGVESVANELIVREPQ